MRHYERYLFLHLLWPTVLITLSLTGIVWLTQVLRFLDFILNRGLSLVDFLYLTGLMLPSLLLMLIPISLGIATIYTYNKLSVESELVVYNAVGISRWQQARPALLLGGICAVMCYVLAIHIMPVSNQRFRDIRTMFRDKYASVLLEEEVFNSPMEGLTVYVRSREQGLLRGILLHDSRVPGQTTTMIAQSGRIEQSATGPRFYLQYGMRQEMKAGKLSWLAFDDYALEISFYGKTSPRSYRPDEQTLRGLYQRDGLSDKQQRAYRAEANQRLTWPLFALVLPMVAIAVLFSAEFSRRGQTKRMMIAGVGIALICALYFALRNLTVANGMLSPLLYVMVLGILASCLYVVVAARIIRFSFTPLLRQKTEA